MQTLTEGKSPVSTKEELEYRNTKTTKWGYAGKILGHCRLPRALHNPKSQNGKLNT